MDTKVQAACHAIGDDKWVDIKYPQAIWDEDEQRWISDAQIAETTYTAFASTRQAITARLIVRRVKRLDSRQMPGQAELFATYRYHAVFTDSPFILVQAKAHHRGHAIIEQVNADLINGPLAHLPSGRFAANGAWLMLAAIAHNLTRAAGTLASKTLAKARGATIRTQIINVAARVATHARHLTLHLPDRWPWQQAWENLFTATHPPPHSHPQSSSYHAAGAGHTAPSPNHQTDRPTSVIGDPPLCPEPKQDQQSAIRIAKRAP